MRRPMATAIASVIGIVIGSAGWISAANAELSATRPVIAILGPDLFVGSATGHLDGSGTLKLHSQVDPSLTCLGEFTSNPETGGAGQLQCSDGATANFKFKRLSTFRGYGAGAFSRGTMSFTYGLTSEQSARYLTVPAGKRLEDQGTVVALVDR
jgi:hypothetical protein